MAKYYYNGVLLPEIPVEVLASFPYAWINSTRNGLVVAGYPWYYSSGKMNIPTSAENRKYVLSSDGSTWVLDSTYTDTGGYSVELTPCWSSHDVPNGSATATEIYLYGSIPVREDKMYIEVIDFAKANWKTQRQDVMSVTDGGTPFYVDSTLPYEGKPTLRSGAIDHSGVSETTITFTLANAGAVELVYSVSSEQKYDWLYIYIDGVEAIKQSGTVAWTAYTKTLVAGEHTLIFKYTKDGSQSADSDAGAVGYIKFFGMTTPYEKKYLIRSGSTVYTVEDSALSALTETEVTASLFRTYGMDNLPDGDLLMGLTDPEVLYWQDSEDEMPELTLTVTGSPPVPQIVVTNTQDMSDPSILGIESATVDASDDVLFAISFDDGVNWKAYDGGKWVTLSTENSGMTKTTMENISLEAWAEVVTSAMYKLRFVLMDTDSYVSAVRVNYIN